MPAALCFSASMPCTDARVELTGSYFSNFTCSHMQSLSSWPCCVLWHFAEPTTSRVMTQNILVKPSRLQQHIQLYLSSSDAYHTSYLHNSREHVHNTSVVVTVKSSAVQCSISSLLILYQFHIDMGSLDAYADV